MKVAQVCLAVQPAQTAVRTARRARPSLGRSHRPAGLLHHTVRSTPQDAGAIEEHPAATEPTGEALVTFEQLLADFKQAAAAGPVDPHTALCPYSLKKDLNVGSLVVHHQLLNENMAVSVEAEVADLRGALEESRNQATELEAQLGKLNDQFLRLNADFDNFRKRTASEKQAITVTTKGDLIQALLPVIDNFELAQSQLKLETEGEQKVNASYQGVYRQMVDIFRGVGLEVVSGEGAPFDPEVHEAIMREESNAVPDGTVLQEFRKGFKLGDKLLRPAMVKVSFCEDANGAAAAAEAAVAEAEKEQAPAS